MPAQTSSTDLSSWLQGPRITCPQLPKHADRPWRLILLGAPGIGKGTQAELLKEKLGCCHLSTGDVFRAAKSTPKEQQSPAIREAIEYMTSGKLVPDATVISMMKERLQCVQCDGGFLLDGFPRTIAQAEALEKILEKRGIQLDGTISYELPVQQVIDRIAGRRVCPQCKRSYHIKDLKPKKEGICDVCGVPLFHREDDRPEAVRVRLETYEKSTAPLIEFYAKRGKLIRINCADTPKGTFKHTLEALQLG